MLKLILEKRWQAFLGFRHVTGIKQWAANEKADFIIEMIDNSGYTYQQVARKIGSNIPAVRRSYIAHKTLLQIEEDVESFEVKRAKNRFAILYMTLSTIGAQQYLQIDPESPPVWTLNLFQKTIRRIWRIFLNGYLGHQIYLIL